MCDFLLARNGILTCIVPRTISKLSHSIGQVLLSIGERARYLPLTHSFSVISANVTVKFYVTRTSLGYIFVADMVLTSIRLTLATEVGEITQNNGHYAVRRHSRSRFRYQSKARICDADFLLVKYTNNLCPMSHLCRVIGDYLSDVCLYGGIPLFNALTHRACT